MAAKLFIFTILLPLSQQCTSKANDVTKKADVDDDSILAENPFRRHLEKSLVNKKFNPPKKVLYGFKPVNLLNTFLDDIPGIVICTICTIFNCIPCCFMFKCSLSVS